MKITIFILFLATFLAQNMSLNLKSDSDHNRNLRLEDHTRLTDDQTIALDKLKSRVLEKLARDFMKQDLYLFRFLEAKQFDVDKAELMVLNHLDYREENKLDTIQDEDWSDMEKDYPYRIESVDKLGRPVIQFDFGKWDLNKAVDSGKLDRLIRYYDKMLDEATMKVIDLQAQGHNVSQWIALGNMQDVNLEQHFGLQASRFYYKVCNTWDNNHPGMSSKVIIINAQPIFSSVMTLARSVLSEKTNKDFKDYGDAKEWKPIVDQLIEQDQLPVEYGGTKRSDNTPAVLVGAFQRRKDGSWWWFL